jgi:hypothetical protein
MDLASLRAQQIELASSVSREDRLEKDPPALIGGADVGFEQGGEVTRAAMVLLTWPELELVEYKVARIATTMPYIPGFLSFREYPALLAAWEQLSQNRICYLSMAMEYRIPVVWGLPATLVCWWMCQPLAWRKNGCAVSLSHSLTNRAPWRR